MARNPHKQNQPKPPPVAPVVIPPEGGTTGRVLSSRAFTIWTEAGWDPGRPDMPPPGTLWTLAAEVPAQRPVLLVLHPMASGQHVKCRWGDSAEIVCYVTSAAHYRKGMEIRGAYPRDPRDLRLWRFEGKPPRRLGFW